MAKIFPFFPKPFAICFQSHQSVCFLFSSSFLLSAFFFFLFRYPPSSHRTNSLTPSLAMLFGLIYHIRPRHKKRVRSSHLHGAPSASKVPPTPGGDEAGSDWRAFETASLLRLACSLGSAPTGLRTFFVGEGGWGGGTDNRLSFPCALGSFSSISQQSDSREKRERQREG